MPSKIQPEENLWFLFICLQKSDYKSIDFTAVGNETNLKPPAARMRFTRLRRQIEDGRLIGTHGTLFIGSADKIGQVMRKRKTDSMSTRTTKKNKIGSDIGKKVKLELYVSSDEYETASSVSASDSEDDKSLAERRFQGTCSAEPPSSSSNAINGPTSNFTSVDVLFQYVVSDRRYNFHQETHLRQSNGLSNHDLNNLTFVSGNNLRLPDAGHNRRSEPVAFDNLDSFDIWDVPSTMPTLMGTSGYLAAQEVAGLNTDVSDEENLLIA